MRESKGKSSDERGVGEGELNIGYRQPQMNHLGWRGGSANDVRAGMEHLKWPVNLEDLNWYLYEVPDAPDKGQWYYWLTLDGGRALAWGGFGEGAAPHEFTAPCRAVGVVNEQRNIECDWDEDVPEFVPEVVEGAGKKLPRLVDDDKVGELTSGSAAMVVFPFDQTKGSGWEGLNGDMLVRAGVATAEDGEGGYGTRKLSTFRFAISEGDDLRVAEQEGDGPEEAWNRGETG